MTNQSTLTSQIAFHLFDEIATLGYLPELAYVTKILQHKGIEYDHCQLTDWVATWRKNKYPGAQKKSTYRSLTQNDAYNHLKSPFSGQSLIEKSVIKLKFNRDKDRALPIEKLNLSFLSDDREAS